MTLHTNCKLMAVKIYCRQFIELSMGGCCSHPSIWVKKSYIQLNDCVGGGGGGLGDIQINESFFTLFFIKLTSLALIIIRLSLVLVYYTEEAGIELNDVQSGNHYVKMLNFPKRIHYIFFSTLCWRDIFGAQIIQRTCIRCKTIC